MRDLMRSLKQKKTLAKFIYLFLPSLFLIVPLSLSHRSSPPNFSISSLRRHLLHLQTCLHLLLHLLLTRKSAASISARHLQSGLSRWRSRCLHLRRVVQQQQQWSAFPTLWLQGNFLNKLVGFRNSKCLK